MARWAKIHDRIAASNGFAETANENREAALLFLLILPQCDVYGVMQAGFRVFTAQVCPLFDITEEGLAQAFDCLERHGLVERYRSEDGTPYIWLPNFLKYQECRWERIGPPEHLLPPAWRLPIALLEACRKKNRQGDFEASAKLREWVAERKKGESKLNHPGPLPDRSGIGPSRQRREVERRKTEERLSPPLGSANDAPPLGGVACSPPDDEHDRAVADLCLSLGVERLPANWDSLCADWVGRFENRAEGSAFLYGVVRVEADRVRAGGKRKGAPRLSEWLSRSVNNRVAEKKTYYA